MNDIKQFTQHILQRKEKELLKQLSEHQVSENNRFEKEHDMYVSKKDKAMQEIDAKETLTYSIEEQKIINHKRNMILKAKQEALLSLFEKAENVMANWSSTHYQQFFDSVIQTLDSTKQYRLSLGERVAHDFVLPDFIKKSDETIKNAYGFVLESEGIVYNYLSHQLLSDLKQDYVGQLATLLDDKK
ncbi:hypothetical protein H1220_04015 [Carnobacteriaceae bacterium zg-84]|uniref:hypothetical protein n=1 Tax=Granulicatella sp. zg-84 TaxID=2678503 RepID=UPI0013C1AA2F|nr:hypothetical protein [Granulicatella sp. zg-84]NEW65728.1 hypothetical protein [Granulicatella sp. zg-84]QMI86518.1 hypothetical protein H1220_04015 [Carnobacteriaceae bacterium zg-84]